MKIDPSQYDQWLSQRKAHREELKSDVLFPRIQSGDRSALATAITLIESQLTSHQEEAQSLIQACLPLAGRSMRIGITGVPGVGKSTLIESLGKAFIAQGHKVAVMAIDPSSSLQGGSILGDKTRMEGLSQEPNAFIRPSPTQGHLGGVAQHTRESIVLCEAAGFDIKAGEHAIVPIMLYDAVLSQKMAEKLLERGIYVIGFYYPVVPKGQARIRVQISAGHQQEHLDQAIDAFIAVGKELGVI